MMPVLVSVLGMENLLFLAVLGGAGALAALTAITRSYGSRLSVQGELPAAGGRSKAKAPSLSSLLRIRYVAWIFALIFVWWIAFLFLDNLFYDRAAARFTNPEELASFMGIYLGGLGLLTLFTNFFVTGQVLGRFGVRTSLLILPVLLFAGTAVLAWAGLAGAGIVLLFWLTTATKLLDMALGFSVDKAAQNVLYQPLPAGQRTQTQSLSEGVVQPLANGMAGVMLIVLNLIFPPGPLVLIFTLLLLTLAWSGTATVLGRKYLAQLVQALSRRRLGEGVFSRPDAASTTILKAGLNSPRPEAVVYSANLLEEADPQALEAAFLGLLAHPSEAVRLDSLRRLERLRLSGELANVRRLVANETSPAVRGEALRALAILSEGEAFEEVAPYLDDPELPVRRGALVGLLHSGGISCVLATGQKLLTMAASPEADERRMAAQIFGEVGEARYDEPLAGLLTDPDPAVRRAALRSASQLKSPRLWPLVLESLNAHATRRAALSALASGGESVLPVIEAALSAPDTGRDTQIRLVRVCGRIRGEGGIRMRGIRMRGISMLSISMLKDFIQTPDEEARTAVLHALSRCGYTTSEPGPLLAEVRSEASLAAWNLAVISDLESEPQAAILGAALQSQAERALERVFLLLSFQYDSRSILRAYENLRAPGVERRAYALEVIDITLPQEFKTLVFALVSDLSGEERLQRLQSLFPQEKKEVRERLEEVIHLSDGRCSPWAKACALYSAYRLSLAKIEPDLMNQNGGSPMLSTIEKVIILKGVNIFSSTPDEILAEVAAVLEEVTLQAGEIVFNKGDLGDSLYLIAVGKVQVYDGEHTLSLLSEGDVFGEMALLDPEPRSASVKALEDTRLLRLDREPFFDLMEDRIEVARGIIQILTRRLRARVVDLNALRSQPQTEGPQPLP
jgi:HEAT repeat protein